VHLPAWSSQKATEGLEEWLKPSTEGRVRTRVHIAKSLLELTTQVILYLGVNEDSVAKDTTYPS